MSIPLLRANGMLLLIQEPLFRLTSTGIECGDQDRVTFVPIRYGLVLKAEIGRSHLITLCIKGSIDGSVAPLDRHQLAVPVLVFRTDFAPALELANYSVKAPVTGRGFAVL